MSRLSRIALRAYPPSFRSRYGVEMAALVEDSPGSARTTADLFLGAARAWLRPSFAGETAVRQRLQASAATTWMAWCSAFCVVPAMTKALLDPPPAGANGGVSALLNVAAGLVVAGWVCALAGAAAIVVKTLVPTLRSGQRKLLLPLVPALVFGAADAACLLVWIWGLRGRAQHLIHPSGSQVALLVAMLVVFVAFLAALSAGPAATLSRLSTSLAQLRLAAVFAVPVALLLTAATACCVVAALASAAPGAVMFGNGAVPPLVLAFACLASVVALVSSARGLRALRLA